MEMCELDVSWPRLCSNLKGEGGGGRREVAVPGNVSIFVKGLHVLVDDGRLSCARFTEE